MSVSVIIPVYNGAAHLRASIDSVLNQSSVGSLELIVVDDGSSDDSARIAASYGDKLKLIQSENVGVSHARNLGIVEAKGQYIQFLDADDLLLPNALAKRIERLRHSGASVCLSHWHELKEVAVGEFIRVERAFTPWQQYGSEPVVAMVNGYWCPPAAWTLQRTNRTQRLRFNERLPLVEDIRFLMDAGLIGASVIEMNSCLALYRITRAPSLSRSSARKFISGVTYNTLHVDLMWQQSEGINPQRREALINSYDYVSRSLYRQDPRLFHEVMAKMLSLAPLSLTWPAVVARLSPLVGYIRAGNIADTIASSISAIRGISDRGDKQATDAIASSR